MFPTVSRVQESEPEQLESWRLHCLIESGYDIESAEKLARTNVDLHEACDLVAKRGCPPALAVLILT